MEKESGAKKWISRIIFGTLFFVIFVGLAIEGCQKGLKVLDVLFATSSLFAGEFYNCIDRNGNTILTNSPQDGMKKCKFKESYKDPTPQERAKEQREIEAYRQRMRTGIERNRAEADSSSSNQAARNSRADRLEAVVKAIDHPLPYDQQRKWEEAARIKADAIRKGYE